VRTGPRVAALTARSRTLPIGAPPSERSSAGNAPASYGTMEKIGTVPPAPVGAALVRAHAEAPPCRWRNLILSSADGICIKIAKLNLLVQTLVRSKTSKPLR